MSKERSFYHINGRPDSPAIVRDGEIYSRKFGIGFHNREMVARLRCPTPEPPDPKSVWLAHEAQDVSERLGRGSSVFITGDLGSGKSAILYGLRTLYRNTGAPYLFFDGHFLSTPDRKITQGVKWALKHDAVVFWDSLDYLVGGSRRVRRTPKTTHIPRSQALMSTLAGFIDEGGRLAGTAHTQGWMQRHAEDELVNGQWQDLLSRVEVHNVRGSFESVVDLYDFYTGNGLPERSAEYLSTLLTNSRFLVEVGENNDFTQEQEQQLLSAVYAYRTAKLITHASIGEPIKIALEKFMSGAIPEEVFLRNFVQTLHRIDEDAKKGFKVNSKKGNQLLLSFEEEGHG